MATEQDAARDRVLAARARLDEQLQLLEASGRAAVDIPARIKRSPAKAAAVAGGVGFLALKGPQRVFRGAKRVIRGKPEPLPKAMLPPEIEKTLRKLGNDGEKVRGALERDFAEYAKQSHKRRTGLVSVLLLGAARPLLARGSRALADFVFTPDPEGFGHRLAQVRERAEQKAAETRAAGEDRLDATRSEAQRPPSVEGPTAT